MIASSLSVGVWRFWPEGTEVARPNTAAESANRPEFGQNHVLIGLYSAYGANAVGLVPHMLFLVDFVQRALGQPVWVGSAVWVTFGLGAMVGPVVLGHLGDRIGFRTAVRLGLLVQAAAIISVAVSPMPAIVFASAFVVGAFVPGIVPLMLGRLHDLVADVSQRQRAWSFATVAFAVGQAAGGYAMSFQLARTGDYESLFISGAVVILVALSIDAAADRRRFF